MDIVYAVIKLSFCDTNLFREGSIIYLVELFKFFDLIFHGDNIIK